ncbi:MAG: spore protease YyaC [Firmicutes bacterium]|nr:spore protease YyaC [Bacillota bacterium]
MFIVKPSMISHVEKSLCALLGGHSAPPIILCIGSDRVTGDCFGPLTGEYLVRRYNAEAFVYGTLAAPVTALNLASFAALIKARHPNHAVLAVDSALGSREDIGTFRVFSGGLYPGAAAGKRLPAVGDFSLTATVAGPDQKELFSVRLGFVTQLAAAAAEQIARFTARFSSAAVCRKA